MKPATAWRLCVLAGLIAFVCSYSFGKIAGLVPCGPAPGGLGPIIGFELARTPAEVAAMFGSGACQATFVKAQVDGLWLDWLGFIPSYTAFLILAAIAASRGTMRRAIVAMLLVAGASDVYEGLILYRILLTLPGTQGVIDQLWWAVHVKFGLLGLATTLIGLAITRMSGPVSKLPGLVVWFGGMAAIYGVAEVATAGMMMTAFTYAWFALLATAIVAAVRPGLFRPKDRDPQSGL